MHVKGAALDNCWGFVDGTVPPVYRPSNNPRALFNGHKRIHAIKFQSVVAPNGLTVNFYSPAEEKKHDSAMLTMSNLRNQLIQYSRKANSDALCIYGDPVYPLHPQLQGSSKSQNLTPQQADFNKSMSNVRTSVEWVFGELLNYFSILDYKKNLKIELSAVVKMYYVCALLTNTHICLYRFITSDFSDNEPPTLEEYFI